MFTERLLARQTKDLTFGYKFRFTCADKHTEKENEVEDRIQYWLTVYGTLLKSKVILLVL